MASESDDEAMHTAASIACASYTAEYLSRDTWKESHYGTAQTAYYLEHESEMRGIMRVDRATFEALLDRLLEHGLEPERTLTAAEKLMHFLYIVGQGSGYRAVATLFKRPLGTISESFHVSLAAILSMYPEVVKEPDYTATPHRIARNPKFFPFFKDCVGALDGSHIKAYVTGETKPYRNRKGDLSQNVLAVVDFNMLFTYVLAGWEGSAADITVLYHARDMEGFGSNLPEGKYYLADAGYTSTSMTLIPFSGGVRYHLKEWLQPRVDAEQGGRKQTDLRPMDEKELFNLRHSSLRNVVERVFGVLKQRFHILEKRPRYDRATQIQLVYALCALHNFVRLTNADDDLFKDEQARMEKDILYPQRNDMHNQASKKPNATAEAIAEKEMDKFQSRVAKEMWEKYKDHLATRGQAARTDNEVP